MWSEILKSSDKKFHFHIELTTKCNSACPLCPRFVYGTPHLNPRIKLNELSLSDIKKWFPSNLVSKIGSMNFCGNFGDPISCKDMYPIIEYFHQTNPTINIEIRTNGGMQSEKMWKKLGKLSKLSKRKVKVIFSVDGDEETNELYRRNVKWDILTRNIKAYTNAGGWAWQEFLIFNHNQHQIEEIQTLSKSMGIETISFKKAFGFEDYENNRTRSVAVYDKKGDFEYLLKPSIDYNHNHTKPFDKNIVAVTDGVGVNNFDKKDVPKKINTNFDICHIDFDDIDYKTYYNEIEKSKIDCSAFINHHGDTEVYLNANGDVRPCCHIGVELDRNSTDNTGKQLKNIFSPNKEYNIKSNSLENILKLFDEKIASNWEKTHEEGRCFKCSIQCGRQNVVDNLYLDYEDVPEVEVIKTLI